MDNATVLDLIPAYALGALDESERAQVEALLAHSDAARHVLLEYEQMLGGLALTVPMQHAPDGSTAAFMIRLQQHEQRESQHRSIRSQRPRQWRPVWVLAAAALVIVLAGIGLWRLRVGSQPDTLAKINAIKTDPAVHAVALKPTDASTSGTLSVVLYGTPDGADAVIDRQQLPALPTGEQYELWMIPNGQLPIGLPAFDPAPPNQPDQTALLVHLPGPMGSYQVVALTVEPRGGSSQPTTKPIAEATISG